MKKIKSKAGSGHQQQYRKFAGRIRDQGSGCRVLLDTPDDNKQSVYERMISERNNIAASYTAQGNISAQKIKNDTTKEVSVRDEV